MGDNADKNAKKPQLQLGSTDESLVLEFRRQAKERKFTQVDVLRVLLNWWLAKDHEEQKMLYFLDNDCVRDHFAHLPRALALPDVVAELLEAEQALCDDPSIISAASVYDFCRKEHLAKKKILQDYVVWNIESTYGCGGFVNLPASPSGTPARKVVRRGAIAARRGSRKTKKAGSEPKAG